MNRIYLSGFTRVENDDILNFMFGNGPLEAAVLLPNYLGHVWPTWQTHFMVPELHRAAAVKLLTGTDQAALDDLADWLAMFPVRWVNEQPDGGWRYLDYQMIVATDSNGRPYSTYGAMTTASHSDRPTSIAGGWFMSNNAGDPYAAYFGEGGAGGCSGYYYISVYWAALVSAVERGVPGSEQAWNTVQQNVTNLNSWRTGFQGCARYGSTPRKVGGAEVP